jgi:type I restriction-modification system DNA methylase subunit
MDIIYKKVIGGYDMSKKNVIDLFKKFGVKHDTFTVWNDFLELAAISISNATDYKEEREQQYLKTIKKYKKEEVDLFPRILAEIAITFEEEGTTDLLGEIFMEMGLGNKWTGQFFTPFNLALVTAELTFDPKDIEEKGYIEFNEPCAGGGAMIIAFAEVMRKHGYNPQEDLKVICNDLDIKSVYMTYIQLSLLGIPAAVLHMNTITLEHWDTFKTPFWKLKGWDNEKVYNA